MVLEREMNEDDEEAMLKNQAEEEEEEEEEEDSSSTSSTSKGTPPSPWCRKMMVDDVARRLNHGDLRAKIEAARDIRRLVRKSSNPNSKSAVRCHFAAAGVIEPLVSMLHSPFPLAARETALLALLNLAARNQRNKIRIVTAGSIPPLMELLKHQNSHLRELAAATILSLSSAESNKSTLASSCAPNLLSQVLCSGSVQARVDAVTSLYNLSSSEHEPKLVLDAKAVVPPLISLLKECKKYSKFAEKTTFLLEILSGSEQGRGAITNVDGGILALVETVEDGSSISMFHAVGALLSLCQSSRDKYRELILREGAIPGLLRLTAEGTSSARDKARTLLDLLRDSPKEKVLTSSELERIVYDFAAQIDGTDKAVETAKRLLQDMVQKSVELNTSRTKSRASPRTAAIV